MFLSTRNNIALLTAACVACATPAFAAAEKASIDTIDGRKVESARSVARSMAFTTLAKIVAALPGIDHMPMIKLINVPKSATAIPVDFGAFNHDPATIAFVRGLYPNARKVWSIRTIKCKAPIRK